MSTSGIAAALVILAISMVWLLLPFSRRFKSTEESPQTRDRLKLASSYERALVTVRDLDEDFQLGKLSPEVYEAERARWVEHGTMLLEALEKAGGTPKKQKRARKDQPESTAAETSRVPVVPVNPAAEDDDTDPVEQAIAAYAKARSRARES